ncbi:MAG: hypothetical protein WCA31_13095 [Acidimicrobiales bacterium]
MGLFRRSRHRPYSADPLEDAAEAKELGREGVLGPQVFTVSPILIAEPGESDIASEEVRAAADPEDDTTKELLIERERRQEEQDY